MLISDWISEHLLHPFLQNISNIFILSPQNISYEKQNIYLISYKMAEGYLFEPFSFEMKKDE